MKAASAQVQARVSARPQGNHGGCPYGIRVLGVRWQGRRREPRLGGLGFVVEGGGCRERCAGGQPDERGCRDRPSPQSSPSKGRGGKRL